MPDSSPPLTRILADAPDGLGADELLPLVYDELRALARRGLNREGPRHTLQPTALVHEAYLRLMDASNVDWRGRTHFLAVAAQTLRRALVDHARAKGREKRGGGAQRITLEHADGLREGAGVELAALDAALEKLAARSPRECRVVELRFLGGLSVQQTAHVLAVSPRTVKNDWRMARAWLLREMEREPS